MASKIRFYLEQSVPELDDLQKKGLFEKKEITMVMRRRTDFEHRIQGRGSKPRDFMKFADFEINLEKLRVKRYLRLQQADLVDTKPSISDGAGFRKIAFIFERALRKFPGDLDIWSKYIAFVKEKDAVKVVYRVYAKLLLLHPRNVDAWLSAAKYEFEVNANATGARELYQRGLRLNPESARLWLSYAQFELTYVSKLLARRKVMGLLTDKQQQEDIAAQQSEYQQRVDDASVDGVEQNEDIVSLDVDKDELNSELALLPEADMNVLGNPDTNPVLKGDIALTVFDLCIPELLKGVAKDLRDDKVFEIAEDFFAVFDKFDSLNRDYLNYHVLSYLQTNYSGARTALVDITLPLRNVSVADAGLAEALQLSVNKFTAYRVKLKDEAAAQKLVAEYTAFLKSKYIDSDEPKSDRTVMLLKAIINKVRV